MHAAAWDWSMFGRIFKIVLPHLILTIFVSLTDTDIMYYNIDTAVIGFIIYKKRQTDKLSCDHFIGRHYLLQWICFSSIFYNYLDYKTG